jgi:hypothetical protein
MKTTFKYENNEISIKFYCFKHLYFEDVGSTIKSLNYWAEHKAPLIFKESLDALWGKRDFIILNTPPVLDSSVTLRRRSRDYNSMFICGAWLDSNTIIGNNEDDAGSFACIVWYQDAREGMDLRKTFQKLHVKWEEIAKISQGF